MRSMLAALATAILALLTPGSGQSAPTNGPRELDPAWHALVHARVVQAPGKVVENATVVIREGLIRSVVPAGEAPAGARVWNCQGLVVYPGLIDCWQEVSLPARAQDQPGRHWNPRVQAERSGADSGALDGARRQELHRLGFTTLAAVPDRGIFRGRATVRQLDEKGTVLRRHAYHGLSLQRGESGYPGSQMGVIAQIRQTLINAQGHASRQAAVAAQPDRFAAIPPQHALEVLHQQRSLPLAIVVANAHEALRAVALAAEASRPLLLVGGGDAYQRLVALRRSRAALILPAHLPGTPNVSDPSQAERISLRQLQHWEQAPANFARLHAAGLRTALSTHGMKKTSRFWPNLHKMLAAGASREALLAALTTVPASLLGLETRIGSVEPGKVANLLICKGSLFARTRGKPRPDLRACWIGGRRVEIEAPSPLLGTWRIEASAGKTAELQLQSPRKGSLSFGGQSQPLRQLQLTAQRLSFVLEKGAFGRPGPLRITAILSPGEPASLNGQLHHEGGTDLALTGQPTAAHSEAIEAEADPVGVPPEAVVPLGAYGRSRPSARQDLILRNATLWTSGPAGTIANGVLVVQRGKVTYAGPADRAPSPRGALEIDCSGRHISPGLIDCHSHTGIRGGINESRQTCTAEVRIADVLDADDINWYRQLAGGLTAANQLHGSANPIGGQNQVVKLRWGVSQPDAMKLAGARPGIKFALGENVKRSGRRSSGPARYPGTRMGVESFIRERLTAARDYARELDRARRDPRQHLMPLRDLELECLAGILAGDRLIHCHSYRQDEILMLCRVAREFGFKVGTFQHVLEGYKVAESIRDAALGASAFSDWWAYKFEVFDAIAYNGALMHRVGVNVSFNSDSNELARRMNTEAAKAVKYGGVPPADALKFVTLNPAIQLGVADRIGSLEPGKDADFVIWSGDPLSSLSRCLATYIDGRRLFSVEEHQELRSRDIKDRARLIRKALEAGPEPGGDATDATGDGQLLDSAAYRRHLLRHWRSQRRRNFDCNCLRDVQDQEEGR